MPFGAIIHVGLRAPQFAHVLSAGPGACGRLRPTPSTRRPLTFSRISHRSIPAQEKILVLRFRGVQASALPDASAGISRQVRGALMKKAVLINVNGTVRRSEVEPRLLLVHYLRDMLGLTGTHVGCETSLCGACTV